MILQKTVSIEDFHKSYLNILNSVLNLTVKEIEILSEFLKIKQGFESFSDEERNKLTFSSTSRHIVCEKLKVSKYNLNNYIKGLKEKRMIIDLGRGSYKLNPYLDINPVEGIDITFKLKLK